MRSFFTVAVTFLTTFYFYAYGEVGRRVLSEPEVTMRGHFFTGLVGIGVYVVLVALLLGVFWPWVLRRLGFSPRFPKTVLGISLAWYGLFWLYGAYSIACDYAFYFGNTWSSDEVLIGFVLLSPFGLPLMALGGAIFGWTFWRTRRGLS
jgi:hypothetical protein